MMTCPERRTFLLSAGRLALAGLGTGLLFGCKTMDSVTDITNNLSLGSGNYNTGQLNSLIKGGRAVAHSFESFTPEQEFYIGRTLGAHILEKYPAYDHPEANRYLNLLGQTISRFCDVPETFAGYHFLIQDSEEINAFAAPGGFIFVTRGLIKCCPTEDSLAAVLAHEIVHVQSKHGLQAIRQSRVTNAFAIIGVESAKHLGSRDLSRLTQTFGDTISDISTTMIKNGYSRTQEYEADKAAVGLLKRVGYQPTAMKDMLEQMSYRLEKGRADFSRTHPDPADRIQKISPLLPPAESTPHPAPRLTRFKQLLEYV